MNQIYNKLIVVAFVTAGSLFPMFSFCNDGSMQQESEQIPAHNSESGNKDSQKKLADEQRSDRVESADSSENQDLDSEKQVLDDQSDLMEQVNRDTAILERARSGVKIEQPKAERNGDALLWDAVLEGDQQLTDEQEAERIERANEQAREVVVRRAELAHLPSVNVERVSDEDNVRRNAVEDREEAERRHEIIVAARLGRTKDQLDRLGSIECRLERPKYTAQEENWTKDTAQPEALFLSPEVLRGLSSRSTQEFQQKLDDENWTLDTPQPESPFLSPEVLGGLSSQSTQAFQQKLDAGEVVAFWKKFDELISMNNNQQKSQTGWMVRFWDSVTNSWSSTRTRTAQSFALFSNALPAALLVGATGGGALYVQWDTPQVKKARTISVDYMKRVQNGMQGMRENIAYWMARSNERIRIEIGRILQRFAYFKALNMKYMKNACS